jgi:hypothetical protein
MVFRVRNADNLVEADDKSQASAWLIQFNIAVDPLENRVNSLRISDGEHDFFFRLDRNSENLFLFMNACAAPKDFNMFITPLGTTMACKFARPAQNLLSTKISSHHEAPGAAKPQPYEIGILTTKDTKITKERKVISINKFIFRTSCPSCASW